MFLPRNDRSFTSTATHFLSLLSLILCQDSSSWQRIPENSGSIPGASWKRLWRLLEKALEAVMQMSVLSSRPAVPGNGAGRIGADLWPRDGS